MDPEDLEGAAEGQAFMAPQETTVAAAAGGAVKMNSTRKKRGSIDSLFFLFSLREMDIIHLNCLLAIIIFRLREVEWR